MSHRKVCIEIPKLPPGSKLSEIELKNALYSSLARKVRNIRTQKKNALAAKSDKFLNSLPHQLYSKKSLKVLKSATERAGKQEEARRASLEKSEYMKGIQEARKKELENLELKLMPKLEENKQLMKGMKRKIKARMEADKNDIGKNLNAFRTDYYRLFEKSNEQIGKISDGMRELVKDVIAESGMFRGRTRAPPKTEEQKAKESADKEKANKEKEEKKKLAAEVKTAKKSLAQLGAETKKSERAKAKEESKIDPNVEELISGFTFDSEGKLITSQDTSNIEGSVTNTGEPLKEGTPKVGTGLNKGSNVTTNDEIENMMQPFYKHGFLGVFNSDDFADVPTYALKRRGSMIINLDPEEDPKSHKQLPGSHWVALYWDLNTPNDLDPYSTSAGNLLDRIYDVENIKAKPSFKGIYYYDSFGRAPSEGINREIYELMKKIRHKYSPELDREFYFAYNTKQMQSERSTACGYFAMLFLTHLYHDRLSEKLDNIVDKVTEESVDDFIEDERKL